MQSIKQYYCPNCGKRRWNFQRQNGTNVPCQCGCVYVARGRKRKAISKKPKCCKPRKIDSQRRWTYAEYIASSVWSRKRHEALTYYKNKCSVCGAVTVLQVHHVRYDNLGHEPMCDLKILCKDCHAVEHENKYGPQDSLSLEFLEIVG